MKLTKVLEQHIAVFGESGSGKTVMVSSFYGATQEPKFLQSSLFNVVADEVGQGNRLHKNYLGMKESAQVPDPTRFSSTSYAFSVKLKPGDAKHTAEQFDAVRLVWHDYPGEWFEQDISSHEEAARRIDAFKSLLGSDVALLLVDGQKLLDNAGAEDRYLKSLLGNFRNGLVRLKQDLLEDGKPLVRFPRIWVLALSKADLLPDLDVYRFRDLVIGNAADDLEELRKEIARIVESSGALAVGEDFVLLSSAKFEPNKINVTERVGLDLVLPLAAMLPFERHIRWVEKQQVAAKVADELLAGAAAIAVSLLGKGKLFGPGGLVAKFVGKHGGKAAILLASQLAVEQLKKLHADALAKQDYLAAVLTSFRLDLDNAEAQQVLLRSKR